MLKDIEIAQRAELLHISKIAEKIGLSEEVTIEQKSGTRHKTFTFKLSYALIPPPFLVQFAPWQPLYIKR